MHLAIDGYNGDREKLADSDFLYRFLDTFPDSIGMTKIASPTVYTYHAPKHEDWGVSGFVIIAESHISIHTFPERNYVNIDVFSCKSFDVDKALDEIKGIFSFSTVKTWILERGLEIPNAPRPISDSILERVRSAEREQVNNE